MGSQIAGRWSYTQLITDIQPVTNRFDAMPDGEPNAQWCQLPRPWVQVVSFERCFQTWISDCRSCTISVRTLRLQFSPIIDNSTSNFVHCSTNSKQKLETAVTLYVRRYVLGLAPANFFVHVTLVTSAKIPQQKHHQVEIGPRGRTNTASFAPQTREFSTHRPHRSGVVRPEGH